MATASSAESPKNWNEVVKTAEYRRQEARDNHYTESASLMFQQLVPKESREDGKNYANEALKNPSDDKFGLKTFDQLKDSQAQVSEIVPEGKTVSHYLLEYFRDVYGESAKENRNKIWRETYLAVYHLVHFGQEYKQEKDGDTTRETEIPFNVDFLLAGDKVVIQNGRLTILHSDGKGEWYARVRGIPLRPSNGSLPDESGRRDFTMTDTERTARGSAVVNAKALEASSPAHVAPAPALAPATAPVVAPPSSVGTAAAATQGSRPTTIRRPAPPPPPTAPSGLPTSGPVVRDAVRPTPAPQASPSAPVRGSTDNNLPTAPPIAVRPQQQAPRPLPPLPPLTRDQIEERISEDRARGSRSTGVYTIPEGNPYDVPPAQ